MRLSDADPFGVVSFQGKSEDFIEGALFILDKIYEAPTVEERPCGEWKEFTVSTYRGTDEWGEPKWGKGKKFICKRCGRRTVIRENFCPNCGADMRDKKDDLAEIIEAVQSIKEGEAE